MNEEQKQEFFEWYQLMKDRAREVWNDREVRPEFKQVFVQSATEPIGIWRDRRQRPGQQRLVPGQDQAQTNSNAVKNEAKTASTEQPKNQPAQQQVKPQTPPSKTDSVMDVVNRHKELEVKGDRILVSKRMEKQDFFDFFQEMKKRGWKYVEAKHIGGEKWEPGYFEMGVKV